MDDLIFEIVNSDYWAYNELRLERPVSELTPDLFEAIILDEQWIPFDLTYWDDDDNEDDERLDELIAAIEFCTPRTITGERTDGGAFDDCAFGGYDYSPHWEGGWNFNSRLWRFPPKIVSFYRMDYKQVAFWRSLGFATAEPLK